MTSSRQATDKALADERDLARGVALALINLYDRLYSFNPLEPTAQVDLSALQNSFKEAYSDALSLVYSEDGDEDA
jgi:hypothetical protein